MSDEHEQVDDEELSAEHEARRRFALAQIRQWPDPVLKLRAQEVEAGEFDDDLRRLVERMHQLMDDANGVGLAGNQAGVLRRLFVFRLDDEHRAAINPRIVDPSDERETDDEGCLSLQGVLVPVERHAALTLEAQDVDGTPYRLELEGLGARVVQHEFDHLDGVLIIERTTPEARREAMATLRPQPILG